MLKFPDLRDHIFVHKLIPDNLCDKLITRLDKRPWKDHKWYDAGTKQDIEEADFQTLKDDTASAKIYPDGDENILAIRSRADKMEFMMLTDR